MLSDLSSPLSIPRQALAALVLWAAALAPQAAEPTPRPAPEGDLRIVAGTGLPVQKPNDAEDLQLTLRIGEEVVVSPDMVLIARPSQVLRLQVESRAASGQRLLPPLRNVGDQGGGTAVLETVERVGWQWTAGHALDVNDDLFLWRTPAQGGYYRITCRVLRSQSLSASAQAAETPLARQWGEASFPILVGEEYDPSKLMLQGVAIGVYPDQTREDVPAVVASNAESYRPPKYLFKVTPETWSLRVSPNFVLGDFAMDRERFGDRQYIALDPALLERLEAILAELRRRDRNARLRVLRGFVSPIAADALRKEGANISEFSRFLYGDAAIIIADADGDERMDDLTGDGKVDAGDVMALSRIVEEVEARGAPGGIGIYGYSNDPTLPDTPFLHVDTRGRRARWELIE